jgi:very-short-patch-repair endonuclease
MSKSKLEDMFRFYMQIKRIPKAIEEYRFDKVRKWRFDFAYPELKIAIECEGGVWNQGRHTRGSGFVKDCDKYNSAVLQGWKVLRYTTSNIKDCINDINKLIDLTIQNK